jgi:hypothetical protein
MISWLAGKFGKIGDLAEAAKLSSFLPLGTFLQSVYALVVKARHMTAFRTMAEANNTFDDKSAKQATNRKTSLDNLGMVGAYGYQKTKRGALARIAKVGIALGQFIARMITLLSGLSSTMVTEAIDLTLALTKGAMKLSESLKGIWKVFKGMRGKRRAEAANTIVDNAMRGDAQALRFLIDAEALSKTWFVKLAGRKFLGMLKRATPEQIKLLNTRPEDPATMQAYLHVCQEIGLMTKLKEEVLETMRSN